MNVDVYFLCVLHFGSLKPLKTQKNIDWQIYRWRVINLLKFQCKFSLAIFVPISIKVSISKSSKLPDKEWWSFISRLRSDRCGGEQRIIAIVEPPASLWEKKRSYKKKYWSNSLPWSAERSCKELNPAFCPWASISISGKWRKIR